MATQEPITIPTYIKNYDQENYNQQLNQTLRFILDTKDGFYMPSLSNADVAAMLALVPAVQPCRFWFNTDLGKMQLLVAVGTVETVTSV
jgi:hypothetical protein